MSSPCPLWAEWPYLKQRIADCDRLALFLDYDGTLTPIVSHPDKARLPLKTKDLLRRLSRQPGVRVTLISGRRLRDLKKKIGLKGLCYVGNHGLELQGPRLSYVNPMARATRPLLKQIARGLKAALGSIRGAWLEDKELTLSLHFRKVAASDLTRVKNAFYEVLQPYLEKRRLRVTTGKRVFEVRPAVRWTKGTIVEWLLARGTALAEGNRWVAVYAGDDRTDEDVFEILRSRGITVVVSPSLRLSQAQYRVSSVQQVKRLLEEILSVWSFKGSGR